MRVYTVHERAWSATEDRDAVLVREGFSWGAALFSVFWAAANGLWRVVLGMLVAEIALAAILSAAGPDDAFAPILWLAGRLVFGLWGNDWKRAALARGGYVLTAIVTAPDRDSAEYRALAEGGGRTPTL
jgi:uncharacterized protein DUF2628